jgi:CRP/FNR family transcriptional regulator
LIRIKPVLLEDAVQDFLTGFLDSDDPQLLSEFLPICIVVTRDRGERLFFEGDPGRHMFYLLSGRVKLFKIGGQGEEVVLYLVQPGEVFAEILHQLHGRYPVNALCLEPTQLLGIDVEALNEIVQRRPELGMQLFSCLAQRVKKLMKTIERLTLQDARTRLLVYFESLAEESGARQFTLPVPKKEIALLLGMTPETFSRLLRQLTDEGLIQADGSRMTLLSSLLAD